MSHSVHPYSHRLGIIRDWKSRWLSANKDFRNALKADIMLREFLEKKMRGLYVSSIEMERNQKSFRIIIKTSRPGVIIGRSGEGSVKLRNDIVKFTKKQKLSIPADFKLDIEEVKSPESNAAIVAYMLAEGLEKRMPFRRVMKQTMEKVQKNNLSCSILKTLVDIDTIEDLYHYSPNFYKNILLHAFFSFLEVFVQTLSNQ